MDQLHGLLSSSEAWLLLAQLLLFLSHLAAAIGGWLRPTQAIGAPPHSAAAESLLMDYLQSERAEDPTNVSAAPTVPAG